MHFRKFSLVVSIAYVLAGCNFPGSTNISGTSERSAIGTAAVETITAGIDQGIIVNKTATLVPNDPTSVPSTVLPSPTSTIIPSVTNTPFPSRTPLPCNMATFIKDVTVPDDTVFGPGATFKKTWRLKNVGTCPWTSGYDLVFTNGDDMSGVSEKLLTGTTIAPGQTLDVSVDLKAPSAEGVYRGDWRLRDSGGGEFGLTTGGTFWVQIEVVAPVKAEITLKSIVNEAVSVRSGGSVKEKLPNVGDTSGNEGSQAFISFDISAIPTDATITEVKVDFSAYDMLGDPFGSLNCLRLFAHEYQPIDEDDYTPPGAVNALASWCTSSQLDSITKENHIKDQLQIELGSSRLELRLQFTDMHHDGDNTADMVRFYNDNVHFVKLFISYTSP